MSFTKWWFRRSFLVKKKSPWVTAYKSGILNVSAPGTYDNIYDIKTVFQGTGIAIMNGNLSLGGRDSYVQMHLRGPFRPFRIFCL